MTIAPWQIGAGPRTCSPAVSAVPRKLACRSTRLAAPASLAGRPREASPAEVEPSTLTGARETQSRLCPTTRELDTLSLSAMVSFVLRQTVYPRSSKPIGRAERCDFSREFQCPGDFIEPREKDAP